MIISRLGGILRDKIYCLMTSSVSLSSKMADVLFDTACRMIRDDSRRKRFRDDGFEGLITTSFQAQSFSGIAGTEFLAEVESDLGKGKVKFLVREADVETRNKLAWAPLFFIEDIPVGLDPSPSRRTAMYN